MTWTDTSSPTRRAAAAPASVAALTAPTSPRTITVTYPAPMYSLATRTTLAALTIASAASIEPMSPRVSTSPSASCDMQPPQRRDCNIIAGAQQRRYDGAEFHPSMQVSSRVLLLCALPALLLVGCRRGGESQPAVATPSITVSRAKAALGSPVEITYKFV